MPPLGGLSPQGADWDLRALGITSVEYPDSRRALARRRAITLAVVGLGCVSRAALALAAARCLTPVRPRARMRRAGAQGRTAQGGSRRMRTPPARDCYSVLGVDPTASQDEIRAAYLARTRVTHPDRFDSVTQPQEWAKACEMQAELNEAFAVLRNPLTRREHDSSRSAGHQPAPSTRPSPRAEEHVWSREHVGEAAELSSGEAVLWDLPQHVQERLLRRQCNQREDQVQLATGSVSWSYVWLCAAAAWICYLFVIADDVPWGYTEMAYYSGVTLAAGLLISRNAETLLRWNRSVLKSFFYITPLYFIDTSYDIVRFWPLCALRDIRVTHNYRNGAYQNSDIELQLDDASHTLTLPSQQDVETLLKQLKTYDSRLRAAVSHRDLDYLGHHDDFAGVPRTAARAFDVLPSDQRTIFRSAAIGGCALLAGLSIVANLSAPTKHVQDRPVPNQVATQGRRSPPSPVPETHAEKTASPEPSVPRMPAPATVSSPAVSGALSTIHEQPMPPNGAVRVFVKTKRLAPFRIEPEQGPHYLVKLVNYSTHSPVMDIFVRSGTPTEVKVPLGKCEVRYAYGDMWCGYKHRFGSQTNYSRAEECFDFRVDGNTVRGYSITLYAVPGGNLRTSGISADEF